MTIKRHFMKVNCVLRRTDDNGYLLIVQSGDGAVQLSTKYVVRRFIQSRPLFYNSTIAYLSDKIFSHANFASLCTFLKHL